MIVIAARKANVLELAHQRFDLHVPQPFETDHEPGTSRIMRQPISEPCRGCCQRFLRPPLLQP